MEKFKSFLIQILRKSEKYFKTDMVYIAQSGFWTNVSFVTTSIIAFTVSVCFAHLISKDTYGMYQYVLSLASVLAAFSLTGMNPAVVRAVAQGNEGTLRRSIPMQLKWSLISSIIALGMAFYYGWHGVMVITISLIIIAILLPLSNAANTYTAFLIGRKNFKGLFMFTLISNLGYAAIMIPTLFLFPHPLTIIAVYFAVTTAMNVVLYFATLKKYKPNENNDPETFTYSKHLSVMGILGTIASRLDSIVIFHFLGPIELAIYSFAKVVPDRLGGLFKSVSTAALPRFANRTEAELRSSIIRKTVLVFIACILVGIIYALLAPLLFKIFFPKYLDSVKYTQIFVFNLIAIPGSIPMTALMSQGAKRELYIFNTIYPIIQILTLLAFVYYYGLWGAIASRIVANIFYIIFALILFFAKAKPEPQTL